MSIVVPYSFTPTPGVSTPLASDIINEVSQDLRQVLAASGADGAILLSYVNRVQLDILRTSRWDFLRSTPQRFVTRKGVTDYWIGAAGSAPVGTFDTGLNLSDVDYVKENDVLDVSNNVTLTQAPRNPNIASLQYPDGTPRMGKPIEFGYDRIAAPNILRIFPAPDDLNSYQPVPNPPACAKVASGALGARTYYVKVTLIDDENNESLPSASTKVFLRGGEVLQVGPPVLPQFANAATTDGTSGSYDGYYVYVGTVEGSETRQTNSGAIASFLNWQEPNTGLVAGVAPPTISTIHSVYGYGIEFNYYKARPQVTAVGQSLMIPWDYKDVIVAGVNALGYVYLKMYQDAQFWRGEYIEGQKGMIRDKNQFPKSNSNFIQPDMLLRTN